jgi:hypothetical protein
LLSARSSTEMAKQKPMAAYEKEDEMAMTSRINDPTRIAESSSAA